MGLKKFVRRFIKKQPIPTKHDLATRLEERRVLALYAKKQEKERQEVLKAKHAGLKSQIKTERMQARIRRLQQSHKGTGNIGRTARSIGAPSMFGSFGAEPEYKEPKQKQKSYPKLVPMNMMPSFGFYESPKKRKGKRNGGLFEGLG